MNKAELLDAMQRDRADLEALVAALSEPQLLDPALDGGWSVKDVLAHISAWERLCASWLKAVARGETPARPEVFDDQTNARIFERGKSLPIAEVLAESRLAHDAIVTSVDDLTEADLADDRRFGWPTWQMASSNSDEHYREHAEAIRTSLGNT